MGLQTNVFRRGATYVWRKRLPPALGSKLMQVSLRTNTPAIARRIAPMVSAEAAEIIEAMSKDRLGLDAARTKLQEVIITALDDLQAIRAEKDLTTTAPIKVSKPCQKPRKEPKSAPKPLPEAPNGYNPALKALVERLLDQKRRQKVSARMLEQIAKVYALFIEITGVKDVRKLEQAHLAHYADTLAKLPAIYRKSPRERRMTIAEIIAARSGKETLSAATINKNLDLIGQLLTKARSEGFENVIPLDLNSLRPRKTNRARDERAAFTADDVQRLFAHPLWQGNLRRNKWRQAGPHIDKTGHYWLPLIAAMTGARREEIAALKVDDIEDTDGIPALHIRPNANRGLKNTTSTRTIPLHPQLIELGLLAHVDALRARKGHNGDLFPDLRPKSKGGSYGQAIDYRFRQLVVDQLGEGTGKVFHSFRHYVATQLGRLPDVKDQTRADILGHVGNSITAERYSEPTPLPIMLDALSQLPPLPIKS